MILSDISKFQSKAWRVLSRSYGSGRVASTYMFYGRPGLGDWPLAISFTALLNCEKPIADPVDSSLAAPCGSCRNCRQISSHAFEGLLFALPLAKPKKNEDAVDQITDILNQKRDEPFRSLNSPGAVSISIEQAREINKRLSRKADKSMTRVVLFYQMEKMLPQSADALLKLIEEPPNQTVIILTTTNPDALLPTIQSRAQKIRLDRTPADVIVNYLATEYEINESKAKLLAKISEGSTGAAIELLSRNEAGEQSIRAVGFLLYKSLFLDSSPDNLSHLAELINPRDRGQVSDLLRLWQSLIRDCVYYAATGDDEDLVNVDFSAELQKLSTGFRSGLLGRQMVDDIKIALADLGRNVHIQGALMALSLKLKANVRACARY